MKLKTKMTLAVSGLVALLLLATTLFTLHYFEHRIRKTISDQQLATCSYIADEIDNTLLTVQEILTDNAMDFPLDALDSREATQRFLRSRTGMQKYFNSHLFVIAADGKLIAESFSTRHERREFFGNEPFFVRTLKTLKPQISAPVSCCKDLKNEHVVMTSPIIGKDGKVCAVLVGSLNLHSHNILTRFCGIKQGKGGLVRLISEENLILIHPEEDRILKETVSDNQNLVADALKGFHGTRESVGRDGEHYLTSVTKLKATNWTLLASIPYDEVMQPIRIARFFFMGTAVVGIVAAIFIVTLYMDYLTRPISLFTKHLRNLPEKKGDERRISIRTGDEIEEMADAFNGMVTELDTLSSSLEHQVDERTAQLADVNVSLLREVEQRVQAQDEISALNEDLIRERGALEAANQELEAFSYSVSHDLRAPLRHVSAYSNILMEDFGAELSDECKGYMERMQNSCRRMESLIDDLLALSRAARCELRITTVDLTSLCRDVVQELQDSDPRREVKVMVADGMTARGDLHLLRIVMQNIIGNAWKYTARTELPEIEIGEQKNGGKIEFFVRDNGAGFDMTYAEKLFDPFQRLHRAEDFEGSGIGLATVMRIINRHDGRIRAVGEPGKGAVFSFTLG
jgi:signal transduction histidine kinase